MQCAGCGNQVGEGDRYCAECGVALVKTGEQCTPACGESEGILKKRLSGVVAAPRIWMLVLLLLAGGMLGGAVVGGIGVSMARGQVAHLESRYADLRDENSALQLYYDALGEEYRQLSDRLVDIEAANLELVNELEELRHINVPFDYYPRSRDEYSVGLTYPHDTGDASFEEGILIGFPNAGEDFVWNSTRGESMQPFFGEGARLIGTRRFEPEDIAVGDIIGWESVPWFRVVHQVIEIQDDGVITKGFNNEDDDGLIEWESIKILWIGVIF